jgi:pimeloyl-ACP methyl ester carboxylesterase
MIPCEFGPGGQGLLGLYHPPRASVARDAAVLLCAPIGQEYMRTHRAVRTLALQLADAGSHVLRFDYLGTGDSAGEITDASAATWAGNIGSALVELADISGASQLTLLGLRSGALLAALADSLALVQAQRLVLWDPVVRGADYLATLQQLHAQMAVAVRPVPPVASNELVGFPYPIALREELAGLDLAAMVPALRAARIDLVASEERADYGRLRAALAAAARPGDYLAVPESGAWESYSEACNVLLAGKATQALCGLLTAGKAAA